MSNITLNDGRAMPALGMGVYKVPENQTAMVVRQGLDTGFRLIDTAAMYRNERGVGEGGGQDDVWITTKAGPPRQERADVARAIDESLALIGRDAVDLYLIHWPRPSAGLFVEAWRGLIDARDAGKATSIGVCNFMPEHLDALADTGVVPAINQIELHPGFQQRDVVAYNQDHGIVTQSWSPLGRGETIGDPRIAAIADRIGATPAQVIIAWHLAKGYAVIPKASSKPHLDENFAARDVTLSPVDVAAIDAMDSPDGRMGPDPRSM